ncbi:hypothetical protein AWM79_13475 [Pseudomonas agarici]|uniref:Uncharacterized protein n=1 Tax=Pseudomonas agarici TaxID=46677 RepID=A0A0X1T2C9_PSEAA|nr:hypothetical protein AWM79_13475 [Pseudomonas agarici]
MLRLALQQVIQLSGTQPRLPQALLLNEIGNLLIQNQTSSIGAIAFVVSLSTYPHELTSPADAQVLDSFFARGLAGTLFYDRETVVMLQDVHGRLEKLRFLIGQRQLLFKLFDALLWR